MGLGFTRVGPRLERDPSRRIAKLFAPGEESAASGSRVRLVADRVSALTPEQVTAELAAVTEVFAPRHNDIADYWRRHAAIVPDWQSSGDASGERTLLLGAYLTHEFSVEAAALCNPSMIAHPDQSGVPEGSTRFLMSVRTIGEGHISSVGFRTGVAGPGTVSLDDPGRYLTYGEVSSGNHRRKRFGSHLSAQGVDADTQRQVLGDLSPRFEDTELAEAIADLDPRHRGRPVVREAIILAQELAANQYSVSFPEGTPLSEQVLWPTGPAESQGIEDVRLVRFTEVDGSSTYLGTYTAYNGHEIAPHLIATKDFYDYELSPMAGPAATNKGMALFPRRIGDVWFALSRWDRENISLAYSEDGYWWDRGPVLHAVIEPWEFVQTGNCGSPIETHAGWLVLTHGVGPMRTYSIGAMLLDLDDPARVIGEASSPLLVPQPAELDGYVPSVVYSCGAMIHDGLLTMPFGINDMAIGFAQIEVEALLTELLGG